MRKNASSQPQERLSLRRIHVRPKLRLCLRFWPLSRGASMAHAQEIDATGLVNRMSAEIAGLDAFLVRGDAYADARLDAGQIIEHASQVTLQLRREPSAIRISNRSSEDTKEIYFNDGRVSVYSTAENFYAQAEIPKGVDSMLDFAVDDIGIESPMLDLIAADVANDLLTDMQSISYLGTSLIPGHGLPPRRDPLPGNGCTGLGCQRGAAAAWKARDFLEMGRRRAEIRRILRVAHRPRVCAGHFYIRSAGWRSEDRFRRPCATLRS